MGNPGRVFVTDEDSSSWHPSSAGGVFLTSFDRSSALHIGAGSSPDEGFFWLNMASFAALPLQ